MMDGPLTELRNQRLPRRKMPQTYGKKKTGRSQAAVRDLFGSDENDLESQLANLSIGTARPPTSKASSKSGPTKFATQIDTPAELPISNPQLVSPEDTAALEPLLTLSGSDIDLFSTVETKLLKSYNIEKIGEGSFAEVIKLTAKSSTSSSQQVPPGGAIIKIIALKTPSLGQETDAFVSTVDSVAREVKVLRTLDSVHGFTRFRGVRVVTGIWPEAFLDAFYTFRRNFEDRALNQPPDQLFSHMQTYALIEMDDAGVEAATINRPSVFQVNDLFWQTAILLANAEEQVEFEHRDLHLSNVCVKPLIQPSRDEKTQNDSSSESTSSRKPSSTDPHLDIDHKLLASMTKDDIPTIKLGLSNLKITIIDYTVTRCLLASPTTEPLFPQQIAYDPMLFVSTLDTPPDHAVNIEDDLQSTTYRKTRAAAQHHKTTTNSVGDKWAQSVPRTNVIWLSYLLDVLTRRAKGRCKKYYVVKGSSRAAKKVQEDMWDVLEQVADLVSGVDPEGSDGSGAGVVGEDDGGKEEFGTEEIERIPGSARTLLARAVDNGWLGREEIEAFKAKLEGDE